MIMSGFTILNVKASANDSESVISHRGLTSGQLRHAKFGTLRRFSKNRQAPRGPDHIAVPVPASACHAMGVAAAQRPGRVPRQQSFYLLMLRLLVYRLHGQPLSIPSDLSSSASRLRA